MNTKLTSELASAAARVSKERKQKQAQAAAASKVETRGRRATMRQPGAHGSEEDVRALAAQARAVNPAACEHSEEAGARDAVTSPPSVLASESATSATQGDAASESSGQAPPVEQREVAGAEGSAAGGEEGSERDSSLSPQRSERGLLRTPSPSMEADGSMRQRGTVRSTRSILAESENHSRVYTSATFGDGFLIGAPGEMVRGIEGPTIQPPACAACRDVGL